MSSPSTSQTTNVSGQMSDLLNGAQMEKKSVKKKELKKENSRMRKEIEEMQKKHEEEIEKLKMEVQEVQKSKRKVEKTLREEENRNEEFYDKMTKNPTWSQHMKAMGRAQDENKKLRKKVDKLEEYEKLYKEAVLDKYVRERKLKCFKKGFNEMGKTVNSEEFGRKEKFKQMAEKLVEIKRKMEDEAKELVSENNQKDIPSTSGGPPQKKRKRNGF